MIKRAPIIAGVVAVVAVVLVYLLLVRPQQSEIAAKEEQLAAAVALQATLQTQLAELEELREKAPEFQRRLVEDELLIPKQADTPGLIRTLASVADNTGVDFTLLSQTTPSQGAGFTSIGITINGTGTLVQVARYLYELENLDRAVKVLDVELTPEAGTTSVSLIANALIFTTDASSGPGSEPGAQSGATATEAPAGTPAGTEGATGAGDTVTDAATDVAA